MTEQADFSIPLTSKHRVVYTDAEMTEAERESVTGDLLTDMRPYVPTGKPPYRPHWLKAKISKSLDEWRVSLPDGRFNYLPSWRAAMDALILAGSWAQATYRIINYAPNFPARPDLPEYVEVEWRAPPGVTTWPEGFVVGKDIYYDGSGGVWTAPGVGLAWE